MYGADTSTFHRADMLSGCSLSCVRGAPFGNQAGRSDIRVIPEFRAKGPVEIADGHKLLAS
jgi:hypothetical protein